ncbi:hypothetical protein CCR94_00960 [Rhodoblastus sphagnicola]|uniref:Uncharacterized protein n=1 Tax=Rhodoblastus sphagnicola TaxID=333368 RepID=A0A2S6NGE3_9HYPH|nr:hypothetical protein [Rhodoblastus sphagnicola]MBB4200885.1 hypothetical protein [Rhodoblastus sphagnicola]PPQ33654.1 hypothetical protein CCR94_00960 [Rhodoblastus sphagnicola]
MFDFSKLTIPTPEERAAAELDRVNAAIAEDRRRRRERSRSSVEVTLIEDAYSRFTASSSPIINFHGLDAQQRRVSVTWFAPDFAERETIDKIIDHLAANTTVTLKSYWKPHQRLSGETAFTFIAQFIEPVFPKCRRPRQPHQPRFRGRSHPRLVGLRIQACLSG